MNILTSNLQQQLTQWDLDYQWSHFEGLASSILHLEKPLMTTTGKKTTFILSPYFFSFSFLKKPLSIFFSLYLSTARESTSVLNISKRLNFLKEWLKIDNCINTTSKQLSFLMELGVIIILSPSQWETGPCGDVTTISRDQTAPKVMSGWSRFCCIGRVPSLHKICKNIRKICIVFLIMSTFEPWETGQKWPRYGNFDDFGGTRAS